MLPDWMVGDSQVDTGSRGLTVKDRRGIKWQLNADISLKESLTFLLGELKKRKIYNIFRVSPPPPVTLQTAHGMTCQDGEWPWFPLLRGVSGEVGGGEGFLGFF